MTDQQHPTICSRCGGLAGRCECAEIRREAFAEAAAWCTEQRKAWLRFARRGEYDVARAGAKVSAYSAAETHFSALARKPGSVK